METTKNKEETIRKETLPPAVEAIKQDARKKPEKYVKDYSIPAEGE